jgi:hypothetical protein
MAISEITESVEINEDVKPVQRTWKQVFSSLKSLDELAARFVFYTPFTYHLVGDSTHTQLPTDIMSYTLAQRLGEHPLVISDLPRPVFSVQEMLLLKPEQKGLLRTLYAVPKEVWDETMDAVRIITIVDSIAGRFCVFPVKRRTVKCPFLNAHDKDFDVWYFNCFGNNESYYYEQYHPAIPPQLTYYPPVTDFINIANQALHAFRPELGTHFEENIAEVYDHLETSRFVAHVEALRRENKATQPPTKTLAESSLSVEARNEYYELIRTYNRIFGINP